MEIAGIAVCSGVFFVMGILVSHLWNKVESLESRVNKLERQLRHMDKEVK